MRNKSSLRTRICNNMEKQENCESKNIDSNIKQEIKDPFLSSEVQDYQKNIVEDSVDIKEELVDIKDQYEEPLLSSEVQNDLENIVEKNVDIKKELVDTEVDTEEHCQPFQFVKCEALEADGSIFSSESANETKIDETNNIPSGSISVCDIKLLKKCGTVNSNLVCATCNKVFKTKPILKKHLKIHLGIKNFECSECDKNFITSYQLKRHMKKHLGIKEFECSICDKKFTERSTLKTHLESHLDIKVKCPICNLKFANTAGNLKKHIARMHAENND